MICGGLAGLTVDLALYPLDTLKTRLQAPEGFLASGGFRGIYRGMQSVALGSAPGSAAFFLAYEQSAPYLSHLVGATNVRTIAGTDYQIPATSPIGHMLAAMVGEVSACTIRVPTDYLKMKLQTNVHPSLSTAFKTAMLTPRVLYNGFGTTLVREIPFSVIQFPLYEFLKRKFHDKRFVHAQNTLNLSKKDSLEYAKLSPLFSSIIGAFCGFVAAGFTTPLDVVRTRIMLGTDPYGNHYTNNPISTMKRIFDEGCRYEKGFLMKLGQQGSFAADKKLSPELIQQYLTDTKTHPGLEVGDRVKYSKGGVKVLFKGVVPRTMWISIGGCVYFGAFEGAKSIAAKATGGYYQDKYD
jgi:solute carrier family 25 S-adenosylmethionine transporter 26